MIGICHTKKNKQKKKKTDEAHLYRHTLPATHTQTHTHGHTCIVNLKGTAKVKAAGPRTLTLPFWSLLPCIATSSYPPLHPQSDTVIRFHTMQAHKHTHIHTHTPGPIIYLLNLWAVIVRSFISRGSLESRRL